MLAGVAAAWIAAGDVGLVAHGLRHVLVWLALAVLSIAGWPTRRLSVRPSAVLALGLLAAVLLNVTAAMAYNVLGVTLALAALAQCHKGRSRRLLSIVALAAGVLGIFRLAMMSIPTVWLLADGIAGALGRLAGAIARRPLAIGCTFGGIDYLVFLGVLLVAWLLIDAAALAGPRYCCGLAAILAGHLAYLAVLAWWPDLAAALPAVAKPPATEFPEPPPWSSERGGGEPAALEPAGPGRDDPPGHGGRHAAMGGLVAGGRRCTGTGGPSGVGSRPVGDGPRRAIGNATGAHCRRAYVACAAAAVTGSVISNALRGQAGMASPVGTGPPWAWRWRSPW